MADRVRVTLIRSTIGAVPKNKKTIEALGLRKLNKTVELPNKALKRAVISEEAADMVQETAKRLVKDTKARRPVPERQDRGLKVARCHYTEEFPREVLNAEIPKIS